MLKIIYRHCNKLDKIFIEAMNLSRSTPQKSALDLKKSLSKWSVLEHNLSPREKECYEMTENMSSSELAKEFFKNCCDFSLIKDNQNCSLSKDKGLFILGKLGDNKKVVFQEGLGLFNLIDALSSGFKDLPDDTIVVHGGIPTGSAIKYLGQFVNSFTEIAEVQVGRELLRRLMSKMAVKKMSKILFIPVSGMSIDGMGLMGNMLCPKKETVLTRVKKINEQNSRRVILFSPEIFDKNRETYAIKCEGSELVRNKVELPVELTIFHELLHYFHKNIAIKEFSIIDGRFEGRVNPGRFDVIRELYGDDEEYRTVYGFTSQGLDPLSEAAYSSDKYKWVRSSYTSPDNEDYLIAKFGENEFQDILVKNIRNGLKNQKIFDKDIGKYYLSPTSSTNS